MIRAFSGLGALAITAAFLMVLALSGCGVMSELPFNSHEGSYMTPCDSRPNSTECQDWQAMNVGGS